MVGTVRLLFLSKLLLIDSHLAPRRSVKGEGECPP